MLLIIYMALSSSETFSVWAARESTDDESQGGENYYRKSLTKCHLYSLSVVYLKWQTLAMTPQLNIG